MLTAKEKALELIDKFIPHTRVYNDEFGWEDDIESSIQCALIAVDEMLKVTEPYLNRYEPDYLKLPSEMTQGYWLEVKQEILKYDVNTKR